MKQRPRIYYWAAAGSVDTDLSFLSFLELYGTDVAKRRMAPGRVVEPLDVIEHIITIGQTPRCFAIKPNFTTPALQSRPPLFSPGRAPS